MHPHRDACQQYCRHSVALIGNDSGGPAHILRSHSDQHIRYGSLLVREWRRERESNSRTNLPVRFQPLHRSGRSKFQWCRLPAPAIPPNVDPVTITAVSHGDPSKIGTAIVSVTGVSGPLSVSVSPFYAFVPHSTSTLSIRQFFVAVTGSGNTAVTWSVQSAIAGQGCGGAACGSVDANGVFTAPTVAPSPNAMRVRVETSQHPPSTESTV
jgi:hypothetical protein